jgi:murein DD-endopeptidase MepM/ murein hydrolase activator NlpD
VARRIVLLLLILAAGLAIYRSSPEWFSALVPFGPSTPHERYSAALRRAGLQDAALARRWLAAAEESLSDATEVALPHREAVWFAAGEPRATAFVVALRRGHRLVVDASTASAAPTRAFVDVFERRDDGELVHVAAAGQGESTIEAEIRRDARYVVRLQVELLSDARVTFTARAEPTLRLPVDRATRDSIQSFFRDPRDGGQREHHGIDIFAGRGTPVVAAAGGIVSSVGTNALGGNIVFVAVPARRESHYYAHLDEQSVQTGTLIAAGDVLGTVGNTGNARTTAPHLHFGIYTFGRGPVDPLPYLRPSDPPPQIQAAASAGLGELARLRSPRAIAPTPHGAARGRPRLQAGTLVRIVGAAGSFHRVRLPDGAEGYIPATTVEPVEKPLRVLRPGADAELRASPAGGPVMDTIPAAVPLDVLGSFADALFVRTPDGRTGWVGRDA